MRKIIAITLVVLALVAFGSWYYFIGRSVSSDLVVTIDHPNDIKVGEPFTVSVQFSNSSDKILNEAHVILTVPNGIAVVGENPNNHINEKIIGDIGPGSVSKEEFQLIALQNPQSVQQLEAKLQYKLANNATTRFESKTTSDLRLGDRALPISFSLPEKAVSGQPFDLTLKYRNNSSKDFSNLVLKLSYPPNFRFSKADPAADESNNRWDIPSLRHGEEQTIVISGSMAGPDQSVAGFQAEIVANLLGQEYSVGNETANLSIAPSPLALSVDVNGKADYVAALDDALTYTIHFKNNSNTPLQNVTVSATLTGELYDIKTITTNGSLNSVTNTLSWNVANTPELSLVGGGSEGSVTFSVKTKAQYPIVRLGDKNYVLSLQAQAESPTVPTGNSGNKTTSVTNFSTKIRGQVELAAKGYYRDAASGVVNKGPYPPRVNQATQYTIHWQIKNYATNVSGVKVHAFLQSGTKVVKIISATTDVKPVYNAASGEITWDVGTIAATRGLISAPVEAIFQVEQTPAVTQTGQSVVLLGESKIEGHDDFTDLMLTGTAAPVTTDLPDDTSITTNERRVQP